MSTASESPPDTANPDNPHGTGQLCMEHSPLVHILLARGALVVGQVGTSVEIELSEHMGEQRAFVRWKCRATQMIQGRSNEAPTKCQALVKLIERVEGEPKGGRPSAYSA